MSGYVYVMDQGNGVVKIGRSQDPDARHKSLVPGNTQLKILHRIKTPNPRAAERKLHQRYRPYRVAGTKENFVLSPTQLDELIKTQEIETPIEENAGKNYKLAEMRLIWVTRQSRASDELLGIALGRSPGAVNMAQSQKRQGKVIGNDPRWNHNEMQNHLDRLKHFEADTRDTFEVTNFTGQKDLFTEELVGKKKLPFNVRFREFRMVGTYPIDPSKVFLVHCRKDADLVIEYLAPDEDKEGNILLRVPEEWVEEVEMEGPDEEENEEEEEETVQ